MAKTHTQTHIPNVQKAIPTEFPIAMCIHYTLQSNKYK